jgi:hypothetical protein
MRRERIAKLVLGCVGICTAGSVAGMGLANYATSGSFDFYTQHRVSDWQPELPQQEAALESTDLAFASDRRSQTDGAAAEAGPASFDP